MLIRRIAAVAALALASSCAHLPPCPAEGGPRWTEWSSPHFRVLTDVENETEAEQLATQLEYFRAAILAAAWRDVPELRERLELVALRGDGEAELFLPSNAGGAFYSYWGTGTIVAPMTSAVGREMTLKHEIVHALMHQLGLDRSAPLWLNEGLAQYLAMTSYDDTNDQIVFGAVDPKALQTIRVLGLHPWDGLTRYHPEAMELARQEATSWLLVHYLFNHERSRFRRFQAGLADATDWRPRWAEIFPELTDPLAIDRQLSRYATEGAYVKYTALIPHPRFSLAARPMTDSEVHALRALLFWLTSRSNEDAPALARRELAEALRLDPVNLRARAVQHVGLRENRSDIEAARALTVAHPNAWEAWMILASAHHERGEPREANEAGARARALGYRDRATPPYARVASPY